MTGITPDITDVAVLGHGLLRLTFADGQKGEVEVLDRMRGPVFEEARSFGKVTVDAESGTIVWPGGADLAPATLRAKAQDGSQPDCAAQRQGRAHVGVGSVKFRGCTPVCPLAGSSARGSRAGVEPLTPRTPRLRHHVGRALPLPRSTGGWSP
jgi:hypothetical protein